MATKKKPLDLRIPENLEDHIFYNFILDDKQKHFRNSIWDNKNICVMADAKAGTGKTTIAVAMGLMMCGYGMYDGMVYIFSPCRERDIGYRPGTTEEKMASYTEALCNALVDLNQVPDQMIANSDNAKSGSAIIQAIPHTFLRGVNLKNKFIIIDECQNYPLSELKKTLTRIHDTSKVVCIGHTGQADIENSSFAKYIRKAKDMEFIEVCELDKNYRGAFSQWADTVE